MVKTTCPKCGSENVNVQVVTETEIKKKHKSVWWWLFVGWWWVPLKWCFIFLPALIVKIFAPKKKEIKQKHVSRCVCQNCGNVWDPEDV